jgi:hypothetical protein
VNSISGDYSVAPAAYLRPATGYFGHLPSLIKEQFMTCAAAMGIGSLQNRYRKKLAANHAKNAKTS